MKLKTLRSCLSKRARAMASFYARLFSPAILLLVGVTGAVAADAPRLCVIVPHFKDEYWLSVGYGMEQAAAATGADLMTFESGGYHSVERQIELLETCLEAGGDAVLLGAVSANDARLVAAVEDVETRVPVLALVNELAAPGLSGWVGVDWRAMGGAVGAFLASRARAEGRPLTAVLITGPIESGWAPILDQGLTAGLANSPVEIIATYRADTGLREQLRQVEKTLAEHPDADVLIGSAPAIEGAMALVRRMPEGARRPTLVATYISHSVLRGLRGGQVAMVPFDDPIAQGRVGVDLALRAISGETFPGLSGPVILPVTSGTPDVQRIELSPSGFFPALQ